MNKNQMKNLKTFEEYTDYRNVTGYGSMGISGDQNTGPSFNKGPDSATYRRPDVITMQDISMQDPYFGKDRELKKRKIRKNRYIDKLRKNKTKYLDDVDKDTQKKMIKENNSSFILKKIGDKIDIKKIYDDLQDVEKVCDYLNEKYKNKLIDIYSKNKPYNIMLVPNSLSTTGKYAKKLRLNVNYKKLFTSNLTIRDVDDDTYLDILSDVIQEYEIVEPIRKFTENDPYGEEEWYE